MALKPATIQTAALKCGVLGFQGSGKTYTADGGASDDFKLFHVSVSDHDQKDTQIPDHTDGQECREQVMIRFTSAREH